MADASEMESPDWGDAPSTIRSLMNAVERELVPPRRLFPGGLSSVEASPQQNQSPQRGEQGVPLQQAMSSQVVNLRESERGRPGAPTPRERTPRNPSRGQGDANQALVARRPGHLNQANGMPGRGTQSDIV